MQTDDFVQLLKGLSFFRLKEGHTIKPFDCGDDDLNEFLFEEAVPYRKQLLATTFVIENDERTLGYYSKKRCSHQKVSITNFAESYYPILNGI